MKWRKPELLDVIRVEGRLHAVMRIDNPGGVTLQPLAEVLARRLLVDRSGEPYLLEDALVDAGWTPPESAGVGQYGAPQ